MVLDAVGSATAGQCPACRTSSTDVHERYVRRPVELPWRGRKARLRVTARRFRCVNDSCSRRTFVEDFGRGLPRYARRTKEATDLLLDLALKAGGEEGSRLAGGLGLPASPDTLLRLIRGLPLPDSSTPRVLGVDDLALRRGCRYATLLVDLEAHCPVDLLKDRDAETLAGWLREHPGVEVISRDRAEAYAEGASAGAPDAIQVADRFHLLQNVTGALDGMLRGRSLSVEEPSPTAERGDALPPAVPDGPGQPADEADAASLSVHVEADPEPPPSPTKRFLEERRQARTARWEKVRHLHEVGVSISQIGREVGITRKTVRRLLASPAPPRNRVAASDGLGSRSFRPRPEGLSSPTLAPYADYLRDRWQQGCTNASRLFREIEAKGYKGSRTLLTQAVRPWRGPKRPKLPKKERDKIRRMSGRTSMRWTCLKSPDKLKDDERGLLERLLSRDDGLALGYDLTQRFRLLLKDRNLVALGRWIDDAKKSDLPTFMGLANGIQADWAAVEAAFLLPWSNGQLEGQVSRVKLIKRQGYGRAKFDLLRQRVLLSGQKKSGLRRYAEPDRKTTVVPALLSLPALELVAA